MDIDDLIKECTGKFDAILVMGPPDSGKTLMAKLLSEVGGHCYLSSEGVFKDLLPDSPLGDLFQKYASRGLLLPDEVVIAVFIRYVQGLIQTNKFHPETQALILEGFPRTLAQAGLFEPYINVKGIINLQLEDQEILFQRNRKKMSTHRNFIEIAEKTFKKRIQYYKSETLKVFSFYDHTLVHAINADQRPFEVFRDILVKLTTVL